ncbi:hypothetical protein BKA70DRAFT_1442276 [Coprinopsis sp. MPI-PUGE-AT-0042]|nr:hypothetical protein BKA70DRAFT_1442276 [Coprinopsis sp. MPI-PUGE-AT-0042]
MPSRQGKAGSKNSLPGHEIKLIAAIVPVVLVFLFAVLAFLIKYRAARKTSATITHVPTPTLQGIRGSNPPVPARVSPWTRQSLTQQEILDRIRSESSSADVSAPPAPVRVPENGYSNDPPSSTRISMARDGLVAMEWKAVVPEPLELLPPAYTRR